ncbi:MAG: sigma-70 family RNA polymerase sigma factor [Saprospiraceae bacterium]|nr:sigma-70 family RNA polymerase sigma factor [Saprospiraceae bacterium]
MTENLYQIIAQCKQQNRLSQKALFDFLKAKMFAVCLRYASNREEAEDFLQEGFVKLFKDLNQYKFEGSFEGWARRVFVNNALQLLRKKKDIFALTDDFSSYENISDTYDAEEDFGDEMAKMLLSLMQHLPVGFRTVLNLYVLEGYSHAQIAEELGISIGTSKSQLNRSKVYLRELLEKKLTN